MDITPKTLPLASVFQIGASNKYIVPVYQRHYSWRAEQIETLFNDIANEDSGYYVGNLLINTEEGHDSIIDGQQRLTTLSMLLLGLYSNMKSIANKPETSEDIKALLYQDIGDIKRQLLVDSNIETPRLQLLDKDQEIFKSLLQQLAGQKIAPGYGNYAFFKRYKYIEDNLLSDMTAHQLHDFYQNKLNKIELLQISVPNLNDAYQVFASLNSKGVPLTPLDLLKNIYLSKHGDAVKWQKLSDVFVTDNDQPDEQKMTRFVQNNYDAFETESVSSLTKGKIVKSYQRLFDKNGAEYIDKLIERAKVYMKIDTDSPEYTYSLAGLAKLDATTSYPFLLNVLVNQVEYQIDESQINQVIRMVINLFIRRNFVLTPKASNLRSAFSGMRKDITDNKFRGENLVSYIARKINVIMPSNQQFENALNEGIYDKNVHTTRFLLISLERKFGNYFHNGNPDSLDDYKGNKLRWSIEHILPQGNLPKYWVDIIGAGNESVAEENQRKNVHRLGNLTLTPYNSGLGQKTFQEKLLYKDPSNDAKVGLTLPLFLNDSIQKNVKEFNIESIEQRNNELIQKVLEIVPSKIEAN